MKGPRWKEGLFCEEGQASVEAAVLLPVIMILLALLCQPACLFYTRIVMQAAAAEGCRLMTTVYDQADMDAACRAYLLRRLRAVPQIPLFHVGGDDGWTFQLEGSESAHRATVCIQTQAQPLPFFGLLAPLMGSSVSNGNILMTVEVSRKTRPDWLEGNYGDWSAIWD